MKLINLLLETFINLWGKDEISKYIDEIWNIMQYSYKDLEGGFATAKSKEELLGKINFAKLVKKGGKIVTVALYKNKLGRKLVAAGTNGSLEGKKGLYSIIKEDVKMKRSWAEVSGAPEHIFLKQGGIPIPNSFAEELLQKPIISKDPDGYHYVRKIGNKEFKKMIIGGTKEI